MATYDMRLVVLASGERLHMLRNADTGVPMFDPTIYSLTQLRSGGLASATLEQALRSVMVMLMIFDHSGIDLDARLNEGKLLEMGEIDTLAAECRRSMAWLKSRAETPQRQTSKTKISSLESARMKLRAKSDPKDQVSAETACIRLFYIGDFLRWRLDSHLLKIGQRDPRFAGTQSIGTQMLSTLAARAPEGRGRNAENQREALSPESRELLEKVIYPSSDINPWKDAHVRERNELMIRFLLELGVRAGELLGITSRDLKTRSNEVFIARRADNPDDPRAYQPLTKTRDRLLEMSDDLAEATRKYLIGSRRAIKGARRHDYLFVASKTGAPLSYQSLAKSFATLRSAHPGILDFLSAHVLRHTWNDDYSERADASGMSEALEKKTRSRLMGWSPTSSTAETYTRRHTRRKANEAMVSVQKKSLPRKPEEKE